MSVNYGGSRTSQMLSQLVLQFSVLYFCSSKRGEKKPKTKRKKKKRKTGFSVGRPTSGLLQHLGFRRLLCALKS
jgi:hypothetical protein